MDERPFSDRAHRPTPQSLARALEGAAVLYDEILARSDGLQQAWNHSKASGWMLKIHDGKKALCYLVPLAGSFDVSSAVREEERAALLEDPQLAELHDALLGAKKYAEGYALRFHVTDRSSARAPIALVERLVAMRTRSRRRTS